MLQQAGMYKTVEGNNDFELTMESNESCRIVDIMVQNPASSPGYISCYTNKDQVGYFRVAGDLGNHLPFTLQDEKNMTLFGWLVEQGIFRPFPVPSGYTFKITGAKQDGAIVTVKYDLYDDGDVSATEPNGPDATEYDYINYGRYSTTLADGENHYQTQQTPSQFPAFPFGKDVPGKTQVTVHGFAASDLRKKAGATGIQITKYIKFVRDRETLFDEDLVGIPLIGANVSGSTYRLGEGYSVAGNYSDVDERPPKIFDTPLQFDPGESLDVIVRTSVVSGAALMDADETEVAMIQTVKRIQ